MLNQQIRVKLKYLGMILFLLMCLIMLVRSAINMSQGGFLLVPYFLDESADWATFQSNIKPISIEYPGNWRADNLPQGQAGDDETIAYIGPVHPSTYPYVQIAYRKITTPSLEAVANWGESRIIGSPQRNIPVNNYETTSMDKVNIDGREVLLKQYHFFDNSSRRIDCNHIYLLSGNDAYIVEMCIDKKNDSPELQSVWKRMIESISLTGS
jgi:hypothetical protein